MASLAVSATGRSIAVLLFSEVVEGGRWSAVQAPGHVYPSDGLAAPFRPVIIASPSEKGREKQDQTSSTGEEERIFFSFQVISWLQYDSPTL